ncbi:MAG: CoA activase [Deltaproteobacteria bacterium]|nr:CoA activase [Deltaproteobacteria bacterium]MBW2309885.1 CoA activase [Deltaproteobacteria bacterium]
MAKVMQLDTFRVMAERVGRFDVQGKRFLIPEMNPVNSHLLAGVFQSYGVKSEVMETYTGLDLGKKYTSGKECFPCVVTLGDILYFMQKEQQRLGDKFNPENYMYFMPEANGPCRFGMYNKYHRIILDSMPGLEKVKITSLSSDDAYDLEGLIPREKMRDFRKAGYLSIMVGDILDRVLWRVRPYERSEGVTDAFILDARKQLTESFAKHSFTGNLSAILLDLEEIVKGAKELIDPSIPRKPLIGVVGEIYVRTHVKSNQDTIRVLERYGAEAVNASIGEWINYTTYEQARLARIALRLHLKSFRLKELKRDLVKYLVFNLTLFYQYMQQRKVYKMVQKYLDIMDDHKIGHLEKVLKKNNVFSFEVGTEACLSISSALEHARHGYNGIVNIFPFTCMPSNLTASITKPLMAKLNVPYIDVSCDGSYQPGREAALRTFMYQASQHFKAHGRP